MMGKLSQAFLHLECNENIEKKRFPLFLNTKKSNQPTEFTILCRTPELIVNDLKLNSLI